MAGGYSYFGDVCPQEPDEVENYAKCVMELGFLFRSLFNMTCFPDMNRALPLFKLSMMMFHTHKTISKYSYEVLHLLIHQNVILSEANANQEFYELFVNTSGFAAGNIPCDLQMEYIVRAIKKKNKTDACGPHHTTC